MPSMNFNEWVNASVGAFFSLIVLVGIPLAVLWVF